MCVAGERVSYATKVSSRATKARRRVSFCGFCEDCLFLVVLDRVVTCTTISPIGQIRRVTCKLVVVGDVGSRNSVFARVAKGMMVFYGGLEELVS